MRPGRLLAAVVVLRMLTTAAAAADLQPRTVAAFDRYVRATEAQMVRDPFLRIDGFSDVERRAKLGQALDLLQDYDRHAEIFRPAIPRSKLVSRNGDVFRVDLRFYMKKAITVVVNTTTRKTLASHR